MLHREKIVVQRNKMVLQPKKIILQRPKIIPHHENSTAPKGSTAKSKPTPLAPDPAALRGRLVEDAA